MGKSTARTAVKGKILNFYFSLYSSIESVQLNSAIML